MAPSKTISSAPQSANAPAAAVGAGVVKKQRKSPTKANVEKYSKATKRWAPEEEEKLWSLRNLPYKQIAAQMSRTEQSLRIRFHHLLKKKNKENKSSKSSLPSTPVVDRDVTEAAATLLDMCERADSTATTANDDPEAGAEEVSEWQRKMDTALTMVELSRRKAQREETRFFWGVSDAPHHRFRRFVKVENDVVQRAESSSSK